MSTNPQSPAFGQVSEALKFESATLRYVLDLGNQLGPRSGVDTFKAQRKREQRQFGEYRTQRLVLEAWDRLERNGTFGQKA
jgi:hypothetical protein